MANTIGWGQAAVNNTIDWGKGKTNNTIGWGTIYSSSPYGDTDLIGTPAGDADANAFISAAAITDATQKSAIDKLVVDLKGYGIWSKMNAIYPFIGGTSSTHKYNLKDPRDLDAAYRITFNGGWVHSSNGITSNGTNSFADTKLVYTTLNNGHQSLYSRTTTKETQASFDMGSQGVGGGKFQLLALYSVANFFYGAFNEDINTRATMTNSSGLFVNNRTGASAANLWRNGGKLIQTTNAVTNITNLSSYIGAFQDYANYAGYYAKKNYAFSSIGEGLTDTEAANYYTAVQTFQTTLGRNV